MTVTISNATEFEAFLEKLKIIAHITGRRAAFYDRPAVVVAWVDWGERESDRCALRGGWGCYDRHFAFTTNQLYMVSRIERHGDHYYITHCTVAFSCDSASPKWRSSYRTIVHNSVVFAVTEFSALIERNKYYWDKTIIILHGVLCSIYTQAAIIFSANPVYDFN